MKAWKSHIAVFLLAILAVSILPRELWHECDHTHFTSSDGQEGLYQVSDDCEICDYNFSAFSPVPDIQPIAPLPPTADFSCFGQTEEASSYFGLFCSRGPPLG